MKWTALAALLAARGAGGSGGREPDAAGAPFDASVPDSGADAEVDAALPPDCDARGRFFALP